MKFGNVTYQNFGPIKDASVDYDFDGLTVIEGVIKGRPGCGSNGSGKSYLEEGPTWALFGRCVRSGVKGDSIIRNQSKGGTKVSVEIIGAGPEGSNVIVTRYRKHPKLRDRVVLQVDGVDVSRGTTTQTDKAIEEIIGMNFTTYMNSVVFGSREEVLSFFSAPDRDRKQVMETLLGLGAFTGAEKVARKHLRDEADILDAIDARINTNKMRLDDAEYAVEQLTDDNLNESTVKIKGSRVVLASMKREIAKQEHKDLKLREKLSLFYEELETRQQNRNDEIKQLKAAQDKLESARKDKINKQYKVQHARNILNERVDNIEDLAKSKLKCPVCEQGVKSAFAVRVVKVIKQELQENTKERTKLAKSVKSIELKLSKIVIPPSDIDDPDELVTTRESVSELVATLRDLRRLYHQRESEMNAMLSAKATKDRIKRQAETKVEKLKGTYNALVEERSKTLTVCDMYTFWVEGFGNGGLKSFLIESELPAINKEATRFAQKLLGRGAYVRLKATRLLKSKPGHAKEEMAVIGFIPGLTPSYAQASKGQRKRMDLSLLLAFRAVAARRAAKAFNHLFVDELFDGLDVEGSAYVVDLLKDIAESCPVVLVTHNSQLKSAADRLIVVNHNGKIDGGYAEVVVGN